MAKEKSREYAELRRKNLKLARQAVKDSISNDNIIIHAVSVLESMQKISNTLSKRLREWYSIYLPELSRSTDDNLAFANKAYSKSRKELMKELGISDSMGAELKEKDLAPVKHLAEQIIKTEKELSYYESYLENIMKEHCPNLLTLAGATIGAKLLRAAGSLKKLAMMRSSTIQLLGAEKALFRHIRTGAKPPKYGFLAQHQLIQKTADKGRAARALADKLFLAARVDYFKGDFIADRLLKEIEERLKK